MLTNNLINLNAMTIMFANDPKNLNLIPAYLGWHDELHKTQAEPVKHMDLKGPLKEFLETILQLHNDLEKDYKEYLSLQALRESLVITDYIEMPGLNSIRQALSKTEIPLAAVTTLQALAKLIDEEESNTKHKSQYHFTLQALASAFQKEYDKQHKNDKNIAQQRENRTEKLLAAAASLNNNRYGKEPKTIIYLNTLHTSLNNMKSLIEKDKDKKQIVEAMISQIESFKNNQAVQENVTTTNVIREVKDIFEKNRKQLEIKNNTPIARAANKILEILNKALNTDLTYRSSKSIKQSKRMQSIFDQTLPTARKNSKPKNTESSMAFFKGLKKKISTQAKRALNDKKKSQVVKPRK